MSRLSVDPTEAIIANSLEIYEQEAEQFKKIGGKYKCLCYHGENTPSCVINDYEPFLYKCFGCGDAGNVISFVAKSHNISYSEAILHIQGLKIDLNKSTIPKKPKENKEVVIDWVTCKFEQKHKDYWDKYFIPEEFLNNNGVFAIKKYAINKRIIKLHENTAAFVYEHPSGGCKILQIGDNVDKKWVNNVKNNELWGFPKEKCNQLWVQKSVKDMIVSKYHFQFCTTAVQSENHTIIDANIDKLKTISNDIVLFWGNDPQSVKECTLAQQKYNLKYFNIPKYMYKNDVVDLADCVASYGVNRVTKELQKKGFL